MRPLGSAEVSVLRRRLPPDPGGSAGPRAGRSLPGCSSGPIPSSVVRFLGERSTPLDDLRIVAALPKLPFIAAALRAAPDWLPPSFQR